LSQDNDGTPHRPRRKRPAPRPQHPPARDKRADEDPIRDAARKAAGMSPGGELPPYEPGFAGAETSAPQPDWWADTLEVEEMESHSGFDPQRTLGQWLESLIPPSAQVHFLNAGREFATGVQLTVDHHLGRPKDEPDTRGPVHIEID
jgi:hypothetical protein